MDRTEWVSRFMRRMGAIDARLRPAEPASARFEASANAEPEQVAEEACKDDIRRAD